MGLHSKFWRSREGLSVEEGIHNRGIPHALFLRVRHEGFDYVIGGGLEAKWPKLIFAVELRACPLDGGAPKRVVSK